MFPPTGQDASPEPMPSPEISGDDRLWVVLCFLFTPLFPLIVLLLEEKKDRPFIKYHTIPTLIFGVIEAIVVIILSSIPVIRCISPLIWILNVIYALKANKGNYTDLPCITEFAKKQKWMGFFS